MKISFGKRLLLILHWLLSILCCAALVAACISPQLIEEAHAFLNRSMGADIAAVVLIAALCIYALLSVLGALILFASSGKKEDRGFITVDSSDTGRTRIAIGAVEQMIRQAVRGVDGVADMKTSITNNEDAISISCSVSLASGAHVPTVTMNMQRAIRSYIELNCGVAVRDISVSVHTLEDGEGSRHSRRRAAQPMPAAAPVILPENQPAASFSEPYIEPTADLPADASKLASDVASDVASAEASDEAPDEIDELPELQPIKLTLDPPADAEAPASEEE